MLILTEKLEKHQAELAEAIHTTSCTQAGWGKADRYRDCSKKRYCTNELDEWCGKKVTVNSAGPDVSSSHSQVLKTEGNKICAQTTTCLFPAAGEGNTEKQKEQTWATLPTALGLD
ncbi:hypothetical protein WISP_118284 [Willisornis vidua]|uniref:Uncharacterized protein n=1 Tax=Willisornis vidua TaxID=1566151 RepID=A0ABQ9CYD5_9PASS|nr:hypothetical protein WISP_118284 [Willisornis vidua]